MADRSDKTLLELDDEVELVKVSQLALLPGDILHIQLGMLDMGGDLPPWIPTPDEIEYTRNYWQSLVPVGVKVAVTHIGENVAAIIRDSAKVDDMNAVRWVAPKWEI